MRRIVFGAPSCFDLKPRRVDLTDHACEMRSPAYHLLILSAALEAFALDGPATIPMRG
jgi:hypothetical protein